MIIYARGPERAPFLCKNKKESEHMTQSILQHMHPDDLVPYYNNPRHNQDAVGPVAESIKAFGFKVPIVVDENLEVITGHTRLKAAKQLGLDRGKSRQATRVA